MYLELLSLRNFRNYRQLDLSLPRGLVLFTGANAQGKTNLLEAVYAVALTGSHRAENDREMVMLDVGDGVAYSRVVGVARRGDGRQTRVQIDMALGPREGPERPPRLQKRVRVDGIPRPAADAVGSVAAVLFSVEDLALVTGPPAGRRRYMDVFLSQMDRSYLKALQRYQKVLVQRNHLLRRVRDGHAAMGELEFWDGELCAAGGLLMVHRRAAMEALAPLAMAAYEGLAGPGGPLEIGYAPAADVGQGEPSGAVAGRLALRLQAMREREVMAGQTLVGPHRDDLRFAVGGLEAGTYASRGQVRAVALSLRLAEARHLAHSMADQPILLLDDVLSELDPERQRRVLDAACQAQQALLTAVAGGVPREAAGRAQAHLVVEAGSVRACPLAVGPGRGHDGPGHGGPQRGSPPDGSPGGV